MNLAVLKSNIAPGSNSLYSTCLDEIQAIWNCSALWGSMVEIIFPLCVANLWSKIVLHIILLFQIFTWCLWEHKFKVASLIFILFLCTLYEWIPLFFEVNCFFGVYRLLVLNVFALAVLLARFFHLTWLALGFGCSALVTLGSSLADPVKFFLVMGK